MRVKKKTVLDQVKTVFDRDVWVLVFEHDPSSYLLSRYLIAVLPQGLVKIDKINKERKKIKLNEILGGTQHAPGGLRFSRNSLVGAQPRGCPGPLPGDVP